MPMRRDMMELLKHTSYLEASHMEHSLSSMLVGIHLSYQTSLLDQLLQHSAALLDIMERQRTTMAESEVSIPEELTQQCMELCDKQKRLASDP